MRTSIPHGEEGGTRVSNHEARMRDYDPTHSECPYFGSCFGIIPFSFSMSLMFILMPPGMMISPGF
jgi:hypothetical protein